MSDSLEQSTITLSPETFTNREISTLEFQKRVLAHAKDSTIPLLERIKFLAIVGNNLDEFFMVRAAYHLQKIRRGIGTVRPDGYTPQQLAREIRVRASALIEEQRQVMSEVLSLLEDNGVFILPIAKLNEHERDALRSYFNEEVFPVLTPLAVDHARPFPFISNLSLNLGVYLEHPEEDEVPEFARIKVPISLPRMVNLNNVMRQYHQTELDGDIFVWLEDVIQDNLQTLFPGMNILEAYPFRVLRSTDIDYEFEIESDEINVFEIIEQGVRARRFGPVVRLSVPRNISQRMLTRLIHELEVVADRDVYMIDGALGSASLFELMSIDRPDLKYTPFAPQTPELSATDIDIFSAIRVQDIILHHPYDAFAPVEEFFRSAARDPDVLAIKATLYRVGKNSPIVNSLMNARDNGKQVTVLVELKARFDEENNLEWARVLEEKGVHVVHGVEELPMKTHAKTTLVVRREIDGMRRYVHLGTGNYNGSTARLYTDLGLFTCDPDIADDATRLFNRLTGFAPQTNYNRLLVAPEYLLNTFLKLVDNEIAAAREGRPARLIFKMNQLEEDRITEKLYEASQAGVEIDLIIRGLCCLRPGIPGVSENIRVRSIVGRFLEHSRIYYFQNAPLDHQLYMGSADLMRRNLYNRVEVVFPILDARIKSRIMRILFTNLQDNVDSWELLPDGSYFRVEPEPGEESISAQSVFMKDSFGLR